MALDILNLHNVKCQLRLNKVGAKAGTGILPKRNLT